MVYYVYSKGTNKTRRELIKMGTNNFRNHENGIFVLPLTSFEQMKEWMEEDEAFESYREDGLDDDDVYTELQYRQEEEINEFLEFNLSYHLESAGFTVSLEKINYKEVLHVFRGERKLAEISLESGYYDGVQAIVETDPEKILPCYEDTLIDDRTGDYRDEPVKHKLYEMYTPHNKKMFKVIEEYTIALSLDGVFSNGEAVYSRK